MIGFVIRVIVALGVVGSTVALYATGYWGWGIVMTLVSALVVLTFFRNENIIIALYQMRLGSKEKAYKALQRIKAPQMLPKSQHAYVIYLQAMLGAQELGFAKSEQMLLKAQTLGLRTKQDQAMCKMHLAGICMQTGRKKEAQTLLSAAKKLDENNMLADQIKMMKNQMGQVASKNQMRQAMMMKGRRKSPKMR
ncbi:hypothetical protein SAMN05216474_1871 [Lishizhenia tianjinensis]|uniref:DUF2892 domain-containing protein n=1 Tax=Lishizhenia tianjinensis TaxID=477690 RepID=A0A1I7A3Q7_9FLAO|nr:hypothetical protein [Lishizhenia tianjinensis]SFT69578.1 hypothetical protein SAMN05216474_1871 [Lishizhenia tianjinensis]